jgi:hypothetical protein
MSEAQKTQPTQYQIRVAGALAPERALWFGDLALTLEHTAGGDEITVLSGPVIDRAALFGILSRIRDLGLTLISVNPCRGAGCAGQAAHSPLGIPADG